MSKLVNEILRTKTILEECLKTALQADPQDAQFPLTGEPAKIWHSARAGAFRHALEMLPSLDAPPVPKEPHDAGGVVWSGKPQMQPDQPRPLMPPQPVVMLTVPGQISREAKLALEDFIQRYRTQIGYEYDHRIDQYAQEIYTLENERDSSTEQLGSTLKELDEVRRERDDARAAIRELQRIQH